jgi:hypothetical protein
MSEQKLLDCFLNMHYVVLQVSSAEFFSVSFEGVDVEENLRTEFIPATKGVSLAWVLCFSSPFQHHLCRIYIPSLSLALRLLRDGKSAVRKMYAGCAPRFGGEIKCTHAFLSHQLGAEHSFSIISVYGHGMAWPRLAIKVDLLPKKNCILSICTKNSQPTKCIMISFAIIFNTSCLFLVL